MNRDLAFMRPVVLFLGLLLGFPETAHAADGGKKWPEGFEPFVVGEPDGPGTLRISLTAQAIYQMVADDVDTRDAHLTEYGGKFRRLRFVFSGHLGLPRLRYLLHISTLPASLELMDFWLQYEVNRWLSIRAGNFKIPFTAFRNGSFKGLCMVDWPIVTSFFGAERQKGFLLHNGLGKEAGFEYEFALVTGVASRPPHARGLAGVYGETVPNPSDLTGPALNERIHPELVLHLAYNHHTFQHAPEADIHSGPLRLSAGVSVAWDTRPERGLDVSLRIAPEIWIKAYGFHMQMTGYAGFAQAGSSIRDTQFALVGAVAQAGYTYRAVLDVSVQYALVVTTAGFRADARDRATRIIAGATTTSQFEDLMDRYGDAGTFESRQELSLGLSVFIIGQFLKWSTDLAWLATDTGEPVLHEMQFRSQLQLYY